MKIKHNFAVVKPADNTPAFVTYGEAGFSLCTVGLMKLWNTLFDAQGADVTQAAVSGSMFGWKTPAAKAARDLATGTKS
jgi:hypothetical protein